MTSASLAAGGIQQEHEYEGDGVLQEPRSIEETGLAAQTIIELIAKTMYYRARATESQLSDLTRLSRPVIDDVTALMKRQGLLEATSQAGPLQYEYALTERGRQQALDAFERGYYVGPAPVRYEDYLAVHATQSVRSIKITRSDVSDALAHLVQSEDLVSAVGAGVVSVATVMLYGPSGNGKSTIASAIREMLRTPVAIPHALDIGGHTVRVFDPRTHEALAASMEGVDPEEDLPLDSGLRSNSFDRRYVMCRRPLVTLGSELTLNDLEMGFSAIDRTYTAPPQLKANGGVLVVDDLGRQRVRPDELLNRWMAPMATGIDQLSLQTGEMVRVPFDVILVFATNLDPRDIGDEAFLRRIRHKVHVPDPTREEYAEIFRREAEAMGLEFDNEAVEHVLADFYDAQFRPLRGSHPGDILRNLRDFATFAGTAPVLTKEALDEACRAYFV